MSGINGIGGAGGIDRIMALRAQILEQNQALQRASQQASATNAAPVTSAGQPAPAAANSFSAAFNQALGAVNDQQNSAGQLSEAYQRGENVDIAKVMLARQQASVSFEATLQVRNKLLSAYKDIMSMPV
ncbi:flagellar hook-basal body complex protein FliE [Sphingomonas sp. GlSt437]|uniref:flagellar hook-basal body complex protein FliE n=1 Tax=Sphingomonas sp. GlSt437 TaxID=3389970 RepID=UPI003A874C2D